MVKIQDLIPYLHLPKKEKRKEKRKEKDEERQVV
jgi:hypothetical protein